MQEAEAGQWYAGHDREAIGLGWWALLLLGREPLAVPDGEEQRGPVCWRMPPTAIAVGVVAVMAPGHRVHQGLDWGLGYVSPVHRDRVSVPEELHTDGVIELQVHRLRVSDLDLLVWFAELEQVAGEKDLLLGGHKDSRNLRGRELCGSGVLADDQEQEGLWARARSGLLGL